MQYCNTPAALPALPALSDDRDEVLPPRPLHLSLHGIEQLRVRPCRDALRCNQCCRTDEMPELDAHDVLPEAARPADPSGKL
jgi:hypothetical protein